MIVAWRTFRPAYAGSAFSGEGARLFGGRWNRVGTPAVYLAEHRSLAVLELLVQTLDAADLDGLLIAPATFEPDDVEDLTSQSRPKDWDAHPAPASTAAFGSDWARSGRSLVLRVPSVVLPAESNYVFNPLHPDAERFSIGEAVPLALDPRLVQRLGS